MDTSIRKQLGLTDDASLNDSRTYSAWKTMKYRCKTYEAYSHVAVCERWVGSFANFLADMGLCPNGHELDRKDNEKGYNKANCRWATNRSQNQNRRSVTWVKVQTPAGILTMTLKEAADWHEIDYTTVVQRKQLGWPEDKWFIPPLKKGRRSKQC